jgi:hypothetical protein
MGKRKGVQQRDHHSKEQQKEGGRRKRSKQMGRKEGGDEAAEEKGQESSVWMCKLSKLADKLEVAEGQAIKRATCQGCQSGLAFCSYKGCLRLLEGSCGCKECQLHPSILTQE